MSIFERVREVNRRRNNGEAGFTLIELLVVILIIAILAAVGIVALLSALDSGRKSAATTTLRNAVTTVKAVQTGLAVTDFDGVTPTVLAAKEPDIQFQTTIALTPQQTTNYVGVGTTTNKNELTLSSRNDKDCFFVKLSSTDKTQYAKATANSGNCAAPATWADTQKAGWNS